MIQIMNTFLIGYIISQLLRNRDKYTDRKRFRNTIIVAWSVLYLIVSTFSSNLIFVFGPGAALIIYTYIDYVRHKQSEKEQA